MRNETQRRQKALAVVRDMDTDAIISMLQVAPSNKVPFPAMRDLEVVLQQTEGPREPDSIDLIEMVSLKTPDPNRLPTDREPPIRTLRASEVAKTKDNPLRPSGEPDRSTLSLPGEGSFNVKQPDVSDAQKENVDYLGKLFMNDGSEQENHTDDEGWL